MPGPLASLKVLDFTTLLPGPYATMLLGDMGADILRLESPNRPDLARLMPPWDDSGDSTTHAYLNRNKRSIGLDLKQPEAIALVKALVLEYDILIEQFRPGVMDRLGLGAEALRELNPRLIYCSITGYGQTGPLKHRAGHDINYLALAGVASYTGRRDSGPLPLGVQVADIAGGSLHAVMGILAAAVHRQLSGEGQFIDISMTDCAYALNAMAGAGSLAGGVEPAMESTMLNGGAFYDYYVCADGRWLSVGSLEPQFMAQLAQAIGHPELAGDSLSTDPAVQAHLKAVLRDRFQTKPLAAWQEIFAGIDACVEPVLQFAEASVQPQAQARGWTVGVPRRNGSLQTQMALPIKFSATPPRYDHVGVPVGADTDEVLAALGYSPADIAALRAGGVVA